MTGTGRRRMRLRLAASVLTLALAAAAPAAPSRSWIVGAWALDRRECDAVAALTLRRDGTYFTTDEAGSWQLNGNALTLSPRETYSEGGESRPIASPRPATARVTSVAANRLQIVWRGGKALSFTRCP